MKCAKCGVELLSDAVFCMKCGTKVVESEDQQPSSSDSLESEKATRVPESGGQESEAKQYVRSLRLFVKENQDYYLSKWRVMDNSEGVATMISWNWAAFFFGVLWFGFRKMYLLASVLVFIPAILFIIQREFAVPTIVATTILVFVWLTLALCGNYLYRRCVDRKLTAIKRRFSDSRTREVEIVKIGGQTAWGAVGAGIVLLATALFAAVLVGLVEANRQTAILAEQKAVESRTHEEQLRKEEEEARRAKELLGDEIPCTVNTVGWQQASQLLNVHIQNARTFINRGNGTLTISFDYKFNGRYKLPILKFLVRMFDQNGQYLAHFVTAEYYATTHEYDRVARQSQGQMKVIQLTGTGNILHYPVNLRDAAFIARTEFGIEFH